MWQGRPGSDTAQVWYRPVMSQCPEQQSVPAVHDAPALPHESDVPVCM
jgi:hypothetical protein